MKELAKTGCVEFLSETYAHSLASLRDPDEFVLQVKEHMIRSRNYSDNGLRFSGIPS